MEHSADTSIDEQLGVTAELSASSAEFDAQRPRRVIDIYHFKNYLTLAGIDTENIRILEDSLLHAEIANREQYANIRLMRRFDPNPLFYDEEQTVKHARILKDLLKIDYIQSNNDLIILLQAFLDEHPGLYGLTTKDGSFESIVSVALKYNHLECASIIATLSNGEQRIFSEHEALRVCLDNFGNSEQRQAIDKIIAESVIIKE